MFLVRVPVSIALGLVARKGAERVTGVAIGRLHGIDGDKSPEGKDLSVPLKWALAATIFEAIAFAVARTLADRGTEKIALSLSGKPAPAQSIKSLDKK